MKELNITCDIIADLLPLYHDGVCNENSRIAVAEHLAECDTCRNLYDKIKNSTVETYLAKERNNVVEHHKQAVRRKSRITGITLAAITAIPVLVSLIVNLATGHALDRFFIVLTSLMTFASLTVVPLVFEKEKLLWTLGSFTANLTLLLATCAIYSGGDWFFVAIISVFLGLSIIFAPFVIGKLLTKLRHKGLLAMTIDTVLLYAVVVISMVYAQSGYIGEALLCTTVGAVFPWVFFLVIRYLKISAFTKAGICTIFGGVYSLFMNDIIALILDADANTSTRLTQVFSANLSDWSGDAIINANIAALILVTSCAVGIALITVGLLRKKKAN